MPDFIGYRRVIIRDNFGRPFYIPVYPTQTPSTSLPTSPLLKCSINPCELSIFVSNNSGTIQTPIPINPYSTPDADRYLFYANSIPKATSYLTQDPFPSVTNTPIWRLTTTSDDGLIGHQIVYESGRKTAIGIIILETTDNKWFAVSVDISSDDGDFIQLCSINTFGTARIQSDKLITSPTTTSDKLNSSRVGEAIKSLVVYEEPYRGIANSTTGGNSGNYDFTSSDDIDFPTLPMTSAIDVGFVSLWSPTNEQLLNLSRYMWNADFLTVDFWKKVFANPLELIYGLIIVPIDLRQQELDIIDGQGIVTIGLVSTDILLDKIKTQWLTVDCGELTISETWGAYLDYDPYTKLEIYLPFCGTHPLKVDDFIPGTISVTYNIDLLSGACVALVKSTKTDKHGDVLNSVVYQFMGNCATQVPVTAQQFADAIRSAISIAASIGSMVATGVGGAAASNALTNAGKDSQALASKTRTASSMIQSGASAVENVMNLKPSIERSGAIGSSASLLAIRTPYIILTRPRQAKPENQNVYTGYPSFITETLNDISGWTIVQAIHLDNIPCTADELDEIDSLLKGGVIL